MKRFALWIVFIALACVAFAQNLATQPQTKEVTLTSAQSAELELAYRRQSDIRQRIEILSMQLQELQRQAPEADKALRDVFTHLCAETGMDPTATNASADFTKLVGVPKPEKK